MVLSLKQLYSIVTKQAQITLYNFQKMHLLCKDSNKLNVILTCFLKCKIFLLT